MPTPSPGGGAGTSSTSTVPGTAWAHSSARVNALARATAPELAQGGELEVAGRDGPLDGVQLLRPAARARWRSVSVSRPPVAGAGLVTVTPGMRIAQDVVSVPAATLPATPPPWRYQTRISPPAAGDRGERRRGEVEARRSLVPRTAGANVIVPVVRSTT